MTTQPSDWAVEHERQRERLLPCPLCGERADWHAGSDNEHGAGATCKFCGLSLWEQDAGCMDRAVEKWNRRAPVARELDASGGGHGVPPEMVGRFVEKAAQIISGAPFHSGRSLYKARCISDLALSMYSTPRAAEAGDKDGERYRWLRQFPNNVRAELYAPCQLLMREEHLDAAIDAAMGAVGAGGGSNG